MGGAIASVLHDGIPDAVVAWWAWLTAQSFWFIVGYLLPWIVLIIVLCVLGHYADRWLRRNTADVFADHRTKRRIARDQLRRRQGP